MTGKLYYLTTLGAWRDHAGRFATSHFIALDSRTADLGTKGLGAPPFDFKGGELGAPEDRAAGDRAPDDSARILVLVEADEGAHLALEDDARFEALPHPLVQKPISHAARAALAAHDIPYGATTFDVAEAVSRAHPLLRHRVF
jgi:hypothetical protein